MNKIEPDEQKQICLEMLKYIDAICIENNINYSLCGGTLLGAIRHKGFIPWDDDIDIFLIRSEYEKLLKILGNKKEYKLYFTNDKSHFSYPFAKVCDTRTLLKTKGLFEFDNKNIGIFIDIFPVDGIPNELNEEKKYRDTLKMIGYNCIKSNPIYYAGDKSWTKAIIKLAFQYPKYRKLNKIGNHFYWKQLLDDTMKKNEIYDSRNSGFVLSRYGMKEKFPSIIFMDYTTVEFEGYKFQSIKDYKTYLSNIYGDYMKLPSQENRVSDHEYVAYWKE